MSNSKEMAEGILRNYFGEDLRFASILKMSTEGDDNYKAFTICIVDKENIIYSKLRTYVCYKIKTPEVSDILDNMEKDTWKAMHHHLLYGRTNMGFNLLSLNDLIFLYNFNKQKEKLVC